ncbi:MAG: hypothetical protein PHD65_00875 [Gallionella sp.]|nr:hypothetical protein [Gallionella sp.]
MSKSLTEKLITGFIVGPAKRRYKAQTERKISVLLDTIGTVEHNWKRARELQLKSYESFANGVLFALILQLDLTILLFDQATEPDEHRKNLYSRQLALLLYEGFDDLPSVFGKEFRAALLALPSGKTIQRDLGLVIKYLAALSTAHSHVLKEIRHLVIAHRDHHAIEQLELIRRIDQKELTNIASDLDTQLAELARVLTPAMMEFGNPEIILRQLASRT